MNMDQDVHEGQYLKIKSKFCSSTGSECNYLAYFPVVELNCFLVPGDLRQPGSLPVEGSGGLAGD